MRTFVAVLVATVLLSACGSDDSKKLNQDQRVDGTLRDAFMKSCTAEITTVELNAALSYCQCAMDSMLSKYSADELKSKGVYVIMNELVKDGTIASCKASAGL